MYMYVVDVRQIERERERDVNFGITAQHSLIIGSQILSNTLLLDKQLTITQIRSHLKTVIQRAYTNK